MAPPGTGGLVARALVSGGARPVLAGRDKGRLDALAERLSLEGNEVLETAVAGSESPRQLRELIGAAAASSWSGERARKNAWTCRRRPGQVTAVLAAWFFSAPRICSAGLSCGL
jgi:hypothetical protein